MRPDYTKDELFDDFGVETLKRRYFKDGDNSPQDVFVRVTQTVSRGDEALAERLYRYVSNHWFMYATPILANAPYSAKRLPISCYLNCVGDSVPDLIGHMAEAAHLSVGGGGVGSYWGKVRSMGTKVSSGGETPGVIPFMVNENYEMLAYQQGGARRGKSALYLDVSHPEIEEFIHITNKKGGDLTRRAVHSYNAVCIDDHFMECVKHDTPYPLVDPHTLEIKKEINARELWNTILLHRAQEGVPYIFFKDTANKARPEEHKKASLEIHQSNLCVHGDTLVLTDRGHKPIKNLVGQDVTIWNGEEWSTVKPFQTSENAYLMTVTLSTGESLTCTPYHKFYIEDFEGNLVEKRAYELKLGDVLPETNDPFCNDPEIDIKRVSKLELADTASTYCLTEPKRHMAVFNGILTGQCTEITLPTAPDRTAVCCLSSVNLEKFDEWRHDPNFIPDLITMLDNVLEIFLENASDDLWRAKASVKAERSIGLGSMGWHAYLQKNMIPYDSGQALIQTHAIYSHIKRQAEETTRKLARERGACEDSINFGDGTKRNLYLMAIAPNATSSIICGNTSPSIEPWNANMFSQVTQNGKVTILNKHLDKLIKSKDVDYDDVRTQILRNGGSIQTIDCFTAHEKSVFKMANEIDQRWVIEQASARQQYICQAQSINLFFAADAPKSYVHAVHYLAWIKRVKSLYYYRSQSAKVVDYEGEVAERQTINFDALIDSDDDGGCIACEG